MSRVPPFHSNVTSQFPRRSRDSTPFADDTPAISRWARRAFRIVWLLLVALALGAALIAWRGA